MSSEIPGFYYDRIQRRYYRLPNESFNGTPSARRISERARQEELLNKQSNLINCQRKNSKCKSRSIRSRVDLVRQRQYGKISTESYRRSVRWNLIESLDKNCFLDEKSSLSLSFPSNVQSNYELFLTSSGEFLQIIDHRLYLTKLSNEKFIYRLQDNEVDGMRSSYFIDCSSYFMTSTLLNDESRVIVRFIQFSPNPKEKFERMIGNDPSAPEYFLSKKEKIVDFSTSPNHRNSSLRIRTAGPCCYSTFVDNFAINIDNNLNIYDFQTFRQNLSIRVPIQRVTLSDVQFSKENRNLIFTTNGNQFQQWDIRQSDRVQSLRIPVSCSIIKPLKSKLNSVLISSFDERIRLIDLRYPNKSLLVYEFSSSTSNNPHFTFSVDYGDEFYVAACSQEFVANIWDLNSGELLNHFLCPIRENFVHTSSRCAINSIENQPVLAIYHPEYSRFNRWR